MRDVEGSRRRLRASITMMVLLCFCICLGPFQSPDTARAGVAGISGYVRNGQGSGIPDYVVHLFKRENSDTDYHGIVSAVTDASGYYSFTGLEAGTYKLLAENQNNRDYAWQWWPSADRFEDALAITVSSAQVRTGVNITLPPGGNIVATVKDSGGFLFTALHDTASGGAWYWFTNGTTSGIWNAHPNLPDPSPDGTSWIIPCLPPGTYRVGLSARERSGGPGTWVYGEWQQEWYENARSIDDAIDVVVPEGGTVYLNAVIGPPTRYSSIAGTDRIDTAVKISQQAFSSADNVVIATGYNWPDALGGASLAMAKAGPILLTARDVLSDGVMAEIRRLGASGAIILGGTSAVGREVEAALKAELGAGRVTRLGGLDRYATGNLIAEATVAELGDSFDGTVFVATGDNFPDALAASPLAAAKGWPLFLAGPDGLGPGTVDSMTASKVSDIIILGGTVVVSSSIEARLESVYGDAHVRRLAGSTRYQTAVEVASYGVDEAGLGWDGLAITTGENFPDALAGGVLQGVQGSVMLLTPRNALNSATKACLQDQRDSITTARFLGGTGAVSQAVRNQVAQVLQ